MPPPLDLSLRDVLVVILGVSVALLLLFARRRARLGRPERDLPLQREFCLAFSIPGPGTVPRPVLLRASGAHTQPLRPARLLVAPWIAGVRGSDLRYQAGTRTGTSGQLDAALRAGRFSQPVADDGDAILLIALPPGAYSAIVAGVSPDESCAGLEIHLLDTNPASTGGSVSPWPKNPPAASVLLSS